MSDLTFGQQAVGLTFNPSGDPVVAKLKQAYADVIDILQEERIRYERGERARMYSIAITEAQTSQMWGVKAATWQD